ncbi:glycosyltransferase [Oceanisphaera arctica]|uniref:Glycosyltransferase 2-like domain-containing protein n=1 Tax=Oceanisphaera arctica TaxID=641510 RepID=A0A2P5TLG9_9GAMM|nr:glycosyltransferase [Oceanisphaera arctica]PPL16169.1 hypothetical protein UN63_10025 [Oceanisphaera arctica]GHA06360.1 glycosyl transferase [Oceanisphaera arctica]
MNPLDVIIPVYRGLQETQECILSTLPRLPEWAQLIVINDASPEPGLTAWLRQQAAEGAFTLLENEHNLGFVGTVNRGMELNPERDVLLLNSDVEVPASDWLERMREAAYAHDKVASLTPFSNNATICSFPNFCADNDLFAGLNVTELDAVFAQLSLADPLVEVPTGVGFCMYMRRNCMDAVGLFDEATFGKGYGEENDWCQRAAKAGFVNYHQLNVFAYHKGGVSFQEEGDPRKAKAIELLLGLHPDYNDQVQRFIAADPAKKARRMAALAIIRCHPAPVILLVSHCLGGGVNQHLAELQSFYGDGTCFLRLTPANTAGGVWLHLSAAASDGMHFNLQQPEQHQELLDLLRWLGVARMHLHHTLGVPEPVLELPQQLGCGYMMTIHDYYLLNANPSLTDAQGRFAGDEARQRDAQCAQHYPLPEGMSAAGWREAHLPLLQGAEQVVFPSQDVAARFLTGFGDKVLAANSVVAWHPDSEQQSWPPVVPWQPAEGKKLKVLVLGALSREKGALLLEQVAQRLTGRVEFHLLGYAFKPLQGLINHGPYQPENLQSKLDEIGADVTWFPALCPETYSYTLSTALGRGLPVVFPDIGAFAERTRGRPQSYMLPWNMPAEQVVAFWLALAAGKPVSDWLAAEHAGLEYAACPSPAQGYYRRHYLAELQPVPTVQESLADTLRHTAELVEQLQRPELAPGPLTGRERLLLMLWRVRHWPGVRGFIRLVPYSWQQKLKQRLSKKQLHEILPKSKS